MLWILVSKSFIFDDSKACRCSSSLAIVVRIFKNNVALSSSLKLPKRINLLMNSSSDLKNSTCSEKSIAFDVAFSTFLRIRNANINVNNVMMNPIIPRKLLIASKVLEFKKIINAFI